MIKEAIEKIISLAPVSIHEINGEQYASDKLHHVKRREQQGPVAISFATLSGLKDFIEAGTLAEELMLFHVIDFNHVALVGELQPLNSHERFKYAEAQLNHTGFKFDYYHELEFFIVAVQSLFIPNDVTEELLSVIGNLANEHIQTSNDDGITQTVQVKTGITTKGNVSIENPMTLQPYRTFREVVQPQSEFIFRMKTDGGRFKCALFEADGGAWKLQAIENIKAWLISRIKIDFPVIG